MKNTVTRKCIYCLNVYEYSKSRKFRSLEWDREHVVHDAFGKFGASNLTLVGRVCKKCNSKMGREIDPVFTRSSVEAIDRFKQGQKSADKLDELSMQYLELKFQTCDEWNGVLVEFSNVNGNSCQTVSDQYVFRDRESNRWIHFSEKTFHGKDPRIAYPGLHLHEGPWKLFGKNAAADERLLRRAFYKGVHLNKTGSIYSPAETAPKVILSSEIAIPHQRAIAKIAFNYLAKITEELSLDLALNEAFNGIRDFVINGINPDWRVVQISKKPILSGETLTRRLTNGHLVSVQCKNIGRNVVWFAQVSIFNNMVFNIVLTRQLDMMYYPIAKCHHWDLLNNTCYELPGLNEDLTLIGLPAIAV